MSVAVIIILRNAAFVTKGSMNANQTWGEEACHPRRSEGSGSRAARSFAALRMTESGKDDRGWKEPLVIPFESARDPSLRSG